MSNEDFDPDAFLADNAGEFDPDAFLAETPAAPPNDWPTVRGVPLTADYVAPSREYVWETNDPEAAKLGPAYLPEPAFNPDEARLAAAFKEVQSNGARQEQQILKVAQQLELSTGVVRSDFEGFKRTAEAANFDAKEWMKANPDLARVFVRNPDTASVVTDKDVGGLVKAWAGIREGLMKATINGYVMNQTGMPGDQAAGLEAAYAELAAEVKAKQGAPLTKTEQEATDRAAIGQVMQSASDTQLEAERAGWQRKQAEIDDAQARETRQGFFSGVKVPWARAMEAEANLKASDVYFRLMNIGIQKRLAVAAGDSTTILAQDTDEELQLQQELHDLKLEARPRYFGEESWGGGQTATDIAAGTVSTTHTLARAAQSGSVGVLAGAAAGALAGKGNPATITEGAAMGGRAMGLLGAAEATLSLETGQQFQTLSEATTETGRKLTFEEAAGGAYLYGIVATGLELLQLEQLRKAFGPAGAALKSGGFEEFKSQMLTNPAFRAQAAKLAAKAWVGEGLEEGSQNAWAQLSGNAVKDGWVYGDAPFTPPALDTGEVVENVDQGLKGGLLFAGAGLGVTLGTHALNSSRSTTSEQQTKVLHEMAQHEGIQTAATDISKLVEDTTSQSGQPVTHVHVDGRAALKFFQERGDDAEAEKQAVEALGPDGPQRIVEAATTGGKVSIPVKDYLETFGKTEAAKALLKDTVVDAALATPNELKESNVEVEARALVDAEVERMSTDEKARAAAEEYEASLLEKGTISKKQAKVLGVVHQFILSTMSKASGLDVEALPKLEAKKGDESTSGVEDSPYVKPIERLRTLEAKLSPEKRVAALMTDSVSGLRTETAWNEAPRKPGQVALITSPDMVKAVNDSAQGGHDVSNAMLRGLGGVVAKHDNEAARFGPNFAVHVNDEAHLQQVVADMQASLPAGARIVGAIGPDIATARDNLDKTVDSQRAAGTLAPRGTTAADISTLGPNTFTGVGATPNVSPELAARATSTTGEAFVTEAYLDPRMPGVLTRLGFEHAGPFKWVVAYDVKGLRLVNDKLGKEIGTKLLLAFAEAAKSIGGEHFAFAHFSGDEFASGHETEFEAREFARRLEAQLRTVVLPATLDGVAINIRPEFRAGVGEKTYGEADKALNTAKTRESRTQPGWVADSATGRLHGLPGSESGREGGVRGSEGPVGSEVGAPLGEKAVPEGASNAEQGRAAEGDGSLSDRQGLEALALTPEERKAEEEAIATAEERNARGPLRAEETQALELGFNSKPAVAEARDAITRFSGSRVEERQAAATAFLDWVENAGPAPEVADDIQRKTETWARAFNVVDPQHGLSRLAEISKDGIDPEFRRGATNNPRTPQERAVKEQQRLDFVRNVLGRLNQPVDKVSTSTEFEQNPVGAARYNQLAESTPREVQSLDTTAIREGTESLKVKGEAGLTEKLKPKSTITNRTVAAAMEERARKALRALGFKGGVVTTSDEKAKQALAEALAAEVAWAADPKRAAESAIGWYSKKWQAALDIFSERFPALKKDKAQRGLFTLLTAISSDGEKVDTNFKNAVAIYQHYTDTGGLPSGVGSSRQAALSRNLERISEGIKVHGGLQPFLDHLTTETTAGQAKEAIRQAAQELGVKADFGPLNAFADSEPVPMAALVVGPKLGSFFSNLMGAEGYLTMDRWWNRTINRLRGTLLQHASASGIERFQRMVGLPVDAERPQEAFWTATQLWFEYGDRGFKPDIGPNHRLQATSEWATEDARRTKAKLPKQKKVNDTLNRSGLLTVFEADPTLGANGGGEGTSNFAIAAKAWNGASKESRQKYIDMATKRFEANGEKVPSFDKAPPAEFASKFTSTTDTAEKRMNRLFGKMYLSEAGPAPEAMARELGYTNAAAMVRRFEAERAANTVVKNEFIELNDAPKNKEDRAFQIEVARRAKEVLKKTHGIDISVADLQAAIWYYEKDLYGELGAKQSATTSYEEAARKTIGQGGGLDANSEGTRADSGRRALQGQRDNQAQARGGKETRSGQRLNQLPTPEESKQQAESHLVMLDALREKGAKPAAELSAKARRDLLQGPAEDFASLNEQGDINSRVADFDTAMQESGIDWNYHHKPREMGPAYGWSSFEARLNDKKNSVVSVDFDGEYHSVEVSVSTPGDSETDGGKVVLRTGWDDVSSAIAEVQKLLKTPVSEIDAALNKLNKSKSRLFQDSPSPTPKGYFFAYREALAVKRVVNIFINKTGDVSTGLHEAAHTYLEMLGDVAETPGVKPEVKESWANAMQALGIASRDELGVEQHEKFARGFERYFMEGHASQPALQRVFTQLKLWLLDIYKSLRGLPGDDLSPELKAVFDGLLATKEERDALVAKQGPALFSSAKEAGLTDEEWAAQLQEQREAVAETSRKAELLVLKDRLRVTEAWWKEGLKKLQKYFADEYENLPARKAQLLLEKGKLALDRKAVEEVVGKLRGPGLKTVEEGGVRPAEVAEAAGFPNAASMLSALVALKPKERWVVEQANAEMEKQHPSVLTERTELRKAVSEGLQPYTEKRILSEWAALKKKDPTIKATPAEVLKRAAAIMVERRRMGQLSPGIALTQERAAARRKAKAALKGEWQQAALEARTELLNAYLYHELQKASDEKDKLESTAQRLSKLPARARLGKASPIYRDAVDVLLSGFGLAAAQDDSLTPAVLQQAVAQMNGDAVFVGDPDWLAPLTAALGRGKAFEALSVSEARQLSDALENLQAAARQRTTSIVDDKRQEFDAVKAAIIVETAGTLVRRTPLPEKHARTSLEKMKAGINALDGFLLSPIDLVRDLTGDNPDTMLWRAVVLPMRRGAHREAALLRDAVKPIVDAFEAMPAAMRRTLHDAIDGAALFPNHIEGFVPRRRYELLMMALNSGNEGNLQRLTDGRGITRAEVKTALDLLTSDEVKWVQAVWDSTSSMKEEAFALEERETGLRPREVVATPLDLKGGHLRGGYFPAVAVAGASRVGEQQAADQLASIFDPSYSRPATSKGHLKKRANEISYPIALDPAAIYNHLAQVAHDIALREALKSVGRLVMDEDIKKAFQQRVGEAKAGTFLQWLKDVAGARGLAPNALTQINGWLKSNMASALLSGVSTAIGNFANFPAAPVMSKLKAKHLAAGLAEFLRSPMETRKAALEKSPHLRAMLDDRAQDFQRELVRFTQGNVAHAMVWTRDAGMALMRSIDMVTNTSVWTGAYRQALVAGEDEGAAVRFADDVVSRVAPSASPVERAGILRDKGTWGALATFYGYLSVVYRAQHRIGMPVFEQKFSEASGFSKAMTVGKAAGGLLGLYIAVNVLGDLLMGRGPEGGDDDDDDPENKLLQWKNWFTRKLVVAPLSLLPIVPAATVVESALLKKRATPRADPMSSYVMLAGETVMKGAQGRLTTGEAMANTLRLFGLSTGAPVRLVEPGSKYLLEVGTGQREVRSTPGFIGGMTYGERDNQPVNPFTLLEQLSE